MSDKHTATPWKIVSTTFGEVTIVSPAGDAELGNWIVVERTRWEQDAAFIVRAVNAHDALVEAAKEASRLIDGAVAAYEFSPTSYTNTAMHLCLRMKAKVDAALAAVAEGEP